MGIRNAWISTSTRASTRSHYPSWGSGTGWSGHPTTADVLTSLPLMGIRNHGRQSRRGGGPSGPHYPSWGSGTSELRGVPSPAHNLTTPHGDQERQSPYRSFTTRSPCSHYPSWGSGTVLGVPILHVPLGLTTPHGDQEQRWAGYCLTGYTRLTTPHGDQERERHPGAAVRATAPHYPSWGSGTVLLVVAVGIISVSLPLMGIRNSPATCGKSCSNQLTTPHGDQEPLIFRHFSLLMGSGSVHHACANRQTCAWTPGQRWFSAQAQGIPSENGPVFPVPFVFFLAHLSAEFIFSESVYLDVVPILGNEL